MNMNRRTLLALGVSLPILAMTANAGFAQSTRKFYAEDGIAIDGTDPVAYFTEGAPVAGGPAITHDWMGSTWCFASAVNKAAFVVDPEAHAPQSGRYAAWAFSEGYTASTTPEAWSIVDGKLYLNYSRRIQRRWEKDIPVNISRDTANWPKILG